MPKVTIKKRFFCIYICMYNIDIAWISTRFAISPISINILPYNSSIKVSYSRVYGIFICCLNLCATNHIHIFRMWHSKVSSSTKSGKEKSNKKNTKTSTSTKHNKQKWSDEGEWGLFLISNVIALSGNMEHVFLNSVLIL